MKQEVQNWKKEKVKELSKWINKYPTIAICNLEEIPTKQLQQIRNKLREHVHLIVSKKALIKRALESSNKKKTAELAEYVEGIPALLLSDIEPFQLYSILKKNRSPAPAKAGQEAPKDIEIPAGPTPFAPGPIMSQLGEIGIKPKIEGGKLVIPQNTIVAKKGDKIKQTVAQILSRLDIHPMELGLDIEIALNAEELYKREILDISEEEYLDKIKLSFSEAFNLCMNAEIINDITVPHLLRKAENDVKKLIISQALIWEGETEKLLNLANSQANNLKNNIQGGK